MIPARRLALPAVLASLLIASVTAPALAISPEAGSDAPNLGEITWLANAPVTGDLTYYRGKVIVLQIWTPEPQASPQLTAQINQVHSTYANRGVVVMSIAAGHNSEWNVMMEQVSRHATYPVGVGDISGYVPGRLSTAFVIDASGTVTYAAQGSYLEMGMGGYGRRGTSPNAIPLHYAELTDAIDDAIEANRTPGMPLADASRDASRFARNIVGRNFTRAREDLERALEREDDAEIVSELEELVAFIDATAETQMAELEAAIEARDYARAEMIADVIDSEFQRGPEAEEAAEMIEAIDEDEWDEGIAATNAWRSVVSRLATEYARNADSLDGEALLTEFAERYEGTFAAEFALSMAEGA